MVNTYTIAGRLAKKDMKTSQDGKKYAFMTIAVQENKEKVHFIESTVFGKNAENLEKYCNIGDVVGITGNITTYKDKDRHTHMSLNVKELSFLARAAKKE